MDEPTIFKLRYRGPRFDNARMPVEVLADLPAFRDLLVSYAKDEWLQMHAGRQRVPKGFDKSLAFDLVGIQDGSAVPKLEWNRISAQANLPGMLDEIELAVFGAYDKVVNLIAGNDAQETSLNGEKLRALNRFGAGLREGEVIELRQRGGEVVSLDAYRRKKLITGASETQTYITRFDESGELVGNFSPDSNSTSCYILVRTAKYGVIQIPVDRQQIVEEFSGPAMNCDVQFEVLVVLDSHDGFRSVSEVLEVAVVFDEVRAASRKAMKRLDELRSLPRGWFDGSGESLSDEALGNAEKFLAQRPKLCSAYRIFPTETGGILIDFEHAGWDYSIEFAASDKIEMYGVAIEGREEMDSHEFHSIDAFVAEFDRRVMVNG